MRNKTNHKRGGAYAIAGLSLGVFVAACAISGTKEGVGTSLASLSVPPGTAGGSTHPTNAKGGEWSSEWTPMPMVLSDSFERTLHYTSGEKGLGIETLEQDPTTLEWDASYQAFQTSFELERVITRGSDFIYVVGRARNGDTVIEEWDLPDWTGSFSVSSPSLASGPGVPAPRLNSEFNSVVVVGGLFVPRADRQPVPPETRREVYRGTLFAEYEESSLAVDLQGRFLYLLERPSLLLYLIDLSPTPNAPQAIYGANNFPELEYCAGIVPWLHSELGHCYHVGHLPFPGHDSPGDLLESALLDEDNDGIPESHVTLLKGDFYQAFSNAELDGTAHAWWWVP